MQMETPSGCNPEGARDSTIAQNGDGKMNVPKARKVRQDASHAKPKPVTAHFTASLKNRSRRGLLMALQEAAWALYHADVRSLLVYAFLHEAQAIGVSEDDLFEITRTLVSISGLDENTLDMAGDLPNEVLPELRPWLNADGPGVLALHPDLESSLDAAFEEHES
jgi:hypothetical protein